MKLNPFRRPIPERTEERDDALAFAEYVRLFEAFGFNGSQYMVGRYGENSIEAVRNPIIWACTTLRTLVFSEITFAFQARRNGKFGDIFGDNSLALLEEPWPGGSTGELLARMELDISYHGNSYWVQEVPGLLTRLDPTRTDLILVDVVHQGSGKAIGKRVAGYQLKAQGTNEILGTWLPDEVAHYAPIPDPFCEFRGASWMQALLLDVVADNDMTRYKAAFMENNAVPGLVVKFPERASLEAATKFRDKLESRHAGAGNAFRTLYIGAGADVTVAGSNFQHLAFNDVQSAGETRIAAAAGVPPTLLSLSEGLKGSALNAGNYSATRRRFSDATMRPLWRKACKALEKLVPPPNQGPRLWYVENDVPFLQEDVTDAAEIREKDASTMRTLVDGGFEPESIIKAVQSNDWTDLSHTGLISVQLQPITAAMAEKTPPTTPPDTGGQE